jgi:thioredoxin-related protein
MVHGFIVTFSHPDNKLENIDLINNKLNKLNNLIEICSFCKKIRDDVGQWAQLESYLQKQFDILFSHGVCPECSDKYYRFHLS